ncbi:MAG: hypothetical protein LAO23_19630 [Acidobacteriia bacterium]|nr:hypothetical protein [Terriglobia bacterium]
MRFRTALLAGIAAVITAVLAAQAQIPGVNSNLATVWHLVYEASTVKPTYSASTIVTPVAAADDVCTLQGSATKLIRVRRVIFGGTNANLQADPVAIVKRSTFDTGGTSGLTTITPYDSQSSAATAVAESYTANPTAIGTLVGVISDRFIVWGGLTTSVSMTPTTEYHFGQYASPIFLRNANEQLAINLGRLTYTTGSLACTFEWTEE